MFGSSSFEIFLRLIILFGLLSLALAVFLALLSAMLRMPERSLARQLKLLFGGRAMDTAASRLLTGLAEHPLAGGMGLQSPDLAVRPPLDRSFVIALLDTIREKQSGGTSISGDGLLGEAASIVAAMEPGPTKRALTLLIGEPPEAGLPRRLRGDQVADALEGWVEGAVTRASADHHRRLGILSAVLGAALAAAVDLDSVRLLAEFGTTGAEVATETAAIGWHGSGAARFADPVAGFQTILGWLISGLIISFGSLLWLALRARIARDDATAWAALRRDVRG